MNRTTASNDHHANDDHDGYAGKRHRPWLPVALVAGAVALAVGGYAAFDGSRGREYVRGDAGPYPRTGESGQMIDRSSTGSAYGVGTEEAFRDQGSWATGAHGTADQGASHHGAGTIDQRPMAPIDQGAMDQRASDPGATGPGPTSPGGAPSANGTTF